MNELLMIALIGAGVTSLGWLRCWWKHSQTVTNFFYLGDRNTPGQGRK